MTKIKYNLSISDRMMRMVRDGAHAGVTNIDDQNAIIPMIAWLLWVRAQDETGQVRIVKGPHYQLTAIRVSEATQLESGAFFHTAAGIVFATFSKDLEFDEHTEYKVDVNKGEILVYPAFVDKIGFPFAK